MKLARLSIGSWPWNLLSPFRQPRLIEEHFELNYPAYMNKARSKGTGKEVHRELVRGTKLVSLELERGGVGVRGRACGTGEDEEYTYVRYRSEIGEKTLDGQRVAAVFEIRSRPVVEYADLDDERRVFQIEVLATQRLGDLYSNRQDLVQDFVDSLSDRVGVVSKTGALRLIREILENIVEPEEGVLDVASSLEAAIIVQTLVGELARRGSEAMREGDVESLIEAFEDKFADVSFEENDYRALRSHWEWLLVLEKHYPDTVGPKAHLAIVREAGEGGGDSASWLEREGPEAVLQYLKASVRVGRFLMQQSELPERKAYFKRAVSDVVKLRDFQNKVESVVRQAPDKVDTGPLRAFILSSIEAGTSTAAPGRALEGL